MLVALLPMMILVVLCLVFVVSSTFFIFGILASFRTPHRSSIFFSYSHKDSEIAQKIMKHLDMYRFKIWIDFGLEIPEDRLINELNTAVKGCEIFILLASKNSQDSTWVQFELAEAKKIAEAPDFKASQLLEPQTGPLRSVVAGLLSRKLERRSGQFRDTVVLSLDDWGSEIYAKITELNEELLKDYSDPVFSDLESFWAETESDLSPARKRIVGVLGKGARKVINPQSSVLRVIRPMVTLFDLAGRSSRLCNRLPST